MSNKNKWKEFCSQQDTCEKCKYNGCDCEIEFWKDWARADERAKCETCIHKVTRADIDAIENTARADERKKVLEELRLLMKERADDCSDIPNMFDKGYYKAYEHMCEEIAQLKK